MNRNNPKNSRRMFYRVLITLGGLLTLVVFTSLMPQNALHLGAFVIITLFVALLAYFPIGLLPVGITLIQVMGLGGALLFGPLLTGWAIGVGVIFGHTVDWVWTGKIHRNPDRFASRVWEAGYVMGAIVLPLVWVFFIFGLQGGMLDDPFALGQVWRFSLAPLLAFSFLHGFLSWFDLFLDERRTSTSGGVIAALAFVELAPLPVVIFSVQAYPTIGLSSILLLGSLLTILVVLTRTILTARRKLERRVQELSALNHVSRALRSTLDLDALLPVIQEQVTELLGINNFYVALYDQEKENLWYPLAVKDGVRRNWPRRSLADRLTDRVVQAGKPVFLTPETHAEVVPEGLSPSETMPTSWVGVPLIASNRTIGCLAVFVENSGVVFTQADLNLLVTLSGQVSVAIENALLFDQARRRADQLETLNQLTRLVTASLELDEVLAQVCRAVVEVGGAQWSAIFLIESEGREIRMAHAYCLPDEFIDHHARIPMTDDERTRSLRDGIPTVIQNVRSFSPEGKYKNSLLQAGIHAVGDFPLTTPVGEIGFLSVYFDKPHKFDPEEINLLQTFASQAALMVSNARLHAQTDQALARRVHQLEIVETVGRELLGTIHSDQVLKLILDHALDFTESTCGAVDLFDPRENTLTARAKQGYHQDMLSYSAEKGIAGRVVRLKEAANVGDVSEDPDFLDLTAGKTRSQLSVPIIHENQVLGVITLESPHRNAFQQSDQDFVTQLANQGAIALRNAHLFADVTQARRRLAAILNSVDEGIMMMDIKGSVVLVNVQLQTMTGLIEEELVGVRLSNLPEKAFRVLGYTREEIESLLETIEGGQVPVSSKTTKRISALKPERMIERLTTPVWGQEDRAIGWVIVLRDVTEEHEINQARELITETLIHDLRSPMSAVLGALDLFDELLPPEQHTDMVDQSLRVANRSANRVLNLVETMLDISRIRSGRLELGLTPIKIGSLVKSLMAEFVVQANDYGIILHNEVPDDLPLVMMDKEKISRVITNLVDNALKFTPEGGQVTLSASQVSDDKIALRVFDTGPGIPPEYQDKIFERFAQVPGRRGRKRGSGLGLPFCRMAVEAHGGRIWVESPQDGGSVFTFTLPLPGQELQDQ